MTLFADLKAVRASIDTRQKFEAIGGMKLVLDAALPTAERRAAVEAALAAAHVGVRVNGAEYHAGLLGLIDRAIAAARPQKKTK